jgi:hypothetical protein
MVAVVIRFDKLCKLQISLLINSMSFVISSYMPFPPISWWARVAEAESVAWDPFENFEKMSLRNRYLIADGNGKLLMSVPVEGGRERKSPMSELRISNLMSWQRQHWRTLVSAYNRSPYFQHYSVLLEELFNKEFEKLSDFNLATVHWLKNQAGIHFQESETKDYLKEYPGSIADLRNMKPVNDDVAFPVYQQVFSDKHGFIPDLSLLDLLFAEGPYTSAWIMKNRNMLY